MRIGLIGWATNQGLGTLTQDFCKHLPIDKVLLIKGKYKDFPERFPGARYGFTKENVDWLLDVDVLLTFETPVDWDIYLRARKRGVKTVLIPMYECAPDPLPAKPDLFICPSDLDLRTFKSVGKCERLDVPVDMERLNPRQRLRARVFQHNAGHGGLLGRNGTTELLAAIPMCKTNPKFIIYSQASLSFEHPNVDVRVGNFENYTDLWGEGDVFVFPHKFDGLSLPIQEAMANGMPVLSTQIFPFTNWLPQPWMFHAEDSMNVKVFQRNIDVAVLEPSVIAEYIDEWNGENISKDSKTALDISERKSWKVMKTKYLRTLEKLCQSGQF